MERPTPDVLAYNLGHFHPGSNAVDWWRYSRASGARIFLNPAHINVDQTARPDEEQINDQASFLARRAALSSDPLNTDFINWPVVVDRFNTDLSGDNRIVPHYALGEIHEVGGDILAQMTLGEGAFPIADEDVSQWRTGTVRSIEEVTDGKILPGNQPGQTVWLISIPGQPLSTIYERQVLTIPVSQDVMVRDGIHKDTNYGSAESAYARHDDASADERSAIFLQFNLDEDIDLDDMHFAILSLPVATRDGGNDVHAHLYGIDTHGWDENSLTWENAPNLRQNAPLGREIRHSVVEGAGETAHILGQITASSVYNLRQSLFGGDGNKGLWITLG